MPKILLVEDNDINRDMLSRRLERKGYVVIVAVNGTEGVAKTRTDKPDLVLMDMHLPILDGWEATRQIKADPQTRTIPVVALTADAIAGEREKALAAGCDDYDTKPVDLPRLLAKIDRLLEPVVVQPAVSTNPPTDRQLQGRLLTRLQQQLNLHIEQIVGYSELLLAGLGDRQPDLVQDIQKIHDSGRQLQRLVQAMLNPVLVEMQRQEIDLFAPTLRLEILTPLSTIIGYSEMLLEEASLELMPDLQQIYASAQALLTMTNNLDQAIERLRTSIQSIDPDAQLLATPAGLELPAIAKQSRLLIIDDRQATAKLLSRQLEQYGCQVAIAPPAQAIQTLAATTYDLILLDISSGTGGLQLLAQIQGNQSPVLIFAAADEIDRLAQGIALGAADYLTKPYQSALLWHKVMACLDRQPNRSLQGNFPDLCDHAAIGVYRATAAGSYQQVNPALVELLGYPNAETLVEVGADIANRIYVDRHRYTKFASLLAEQNLAIDFEYQAYRHDGDPIWVAEHARAIRDPDNKLVAYEGIVTDISHRKLAETNLQAQLAAIQIELENLKRAHQAAEIVQTDYFQQIQHGEAPAAPELPADRPRKVLLVEDNELNSDMLSRRLIRSGYTVVLATDGAEGVLKARLEQPDIILMDISLPVMDGWEATQQIKANPQTAQIPIIALTAHAMAGDREKAFAAGCDDYDTKPIELPRLLGKIETCFKKLQVKNP